MSNKQEHICNVVGQPPSTGFGIRTRHNYRPDDEMIDSRARSLPPAVITQPWNPSAATFVPDFLYADSSNMSVDSSGATGCGHSIEDISFGSNLINMQMPIAQDACPGSTEILLEALLEEPVIEGVHLLRSSHPCIGQEILVITSSLSKIETCLVADTPNLSCEAYAGESLPI